MHTQRKDGREMSNHGLHHFERNSRIYTVPNLLSFLRICLIPVLLWLYLVERNYGWTALVLLFFWHGKAATFMLYAMLIVHLAWCDIPMWISVFLVGACMTAVLLF